MRTSRMFLAAVLALAVVTAHSADRKEQNEARLTKMLEGRTAGEPVSCVPVLKRDGFHEIEGVALIYDSGDTLYVARPTDPNALGPNDVMVLARVGSQMCNTDVVRKVDRNGGYDTGVVFLTKFVPYRKQN